MKRYQNDFEEIMREAFAKIKNPTELQVLEYNNTLKGGDCPLCAKAWVETSIQNRFSDYVCFIPDCGCMKKSADKANFEIKEMRFNKLSNIPEKYYKVRFSTYDKKDINQTLLNAVEKIRGFLKTDLYKKKSIVLHGKDSGTGKTHLAISILKHIALKNEKTALFIPCALLKDFILKTEGYLIDIIQKDIVLLDDFDKSSLGKNENDWANEQMHALVDSLTANKKIVIITSNLNSKEEFSKIYKAPIMRRLFEACEFIHMCGCDYSKKPEDLL